MISTGTIFQVSAELPAGINAGNYDALSWTTIGEVVDISEFGLAYNIVEHETVEKEYAKKVKSTYAYDDMQINCAMDEADAGQIIINTAHRANQSYAFRLINSGGLRYHFTGFVTSNKTGAAIGDDLITKSIVISVNVKSVINIDPNVVPFITLGFYL